MGMSPQPKKNRPISYAVLMAVRLGTLCAIVLLVLMQYGISIHLSIDPPNSTNHLPSQQDFLRHANSTQSVSSRPTGSSSTGTRDELKKLARDVSHQCGRTYSDSLPFSSTITPGTCPLQPHVAIAKGYRDENSAVYPGTWKMDSTNGDATTNNACEFKWFLPHEACDLLGSVGKIHFQGDSLIRQLMVGLGVVLSGNFRSGGLAKIAPANYLQACQCERQWQCWGHPAGHRFDGEPNKFPQYELCPNWTRDHVLTSPLEEYDAKIGGPVIVIGNGQAMHAVGQFNTVKSRMEGHLAQARATNGTYIPMTLHFPSENKPKQYRQSQGPTPIENMNRQIIEWAQTNNLWPLRTYEYTKGLWSRDGVHYDDENIIFVQLLLNNIWRMQREHHMLAIVPEKNAMDPTHFVVGRPEDVKVSAWTGDVPRPYQSLSN